MGAIVLPAHGVRRFLGVNRSHRRHRILASVILLIYLSVHSFNMSTIHIYIHFIYYLFVQSAK